MDADTPRVVRSELVECEAGIYRSTIIFDPSPATWLRWGRGLEILVEMAAEAREHQAEAKPDSG